MQTHLNRQEEKDKQSVALYGKQEDTSNTANTNTDENSPRKIAHHSNSPTRMVKSVFGGGGQNVATGKELVVSINKMCASHSGQNTHIIKLFKLACLQYNSQKVPYLGREMERERIIDLQQ